MDPYYNPMGYHPHCSTANAPQVPNKPTGRKNAKWNDREHTIFIVACETVIAEGHRQGKRFTKHGWERLIFLFNSTAGKNWNKTQLKNHWDSMRREHKRFHELIRCRGFKYNPTTNLIVAKENWWSRKIKENPLYKNFKDKDCREIYIQYNVLFGDTFDPSKYAVTPTQLCKMGFRIFNDTSCEDHRDEIPIDVESSDSSDEPVKEKGVSRKDISAPRSSNKRNSVMRKKCEKKKKNSVRELSYLVDRIARVGEKVEAKLSNIVSATGTDPKTCLKELFATGRLVKKTELYYFACKFLTYKGHREMLEVFEDADEKFEWIEYNFKHFKK